MLKLLKGLKNVSEVVTTIGAVVAAAIVAVETYRGLRKKLNSPGNS